MRRTSDDAARCAQRIEPVQIEGSTVTGAGITVHTNPCERLPVRVAVARVALRQCLRLRRVRLSLSVTWSFHEATKYLDIMPPNLIPKWSGLQSEFSDWKNNMLDALEGDGDKSGLASASLLLGVAQDLTSTLTPIATRGSRVSQIYLCKYTYV